MKKQKSDFENTFRCDHCGKIIEREKKIYTSSDDTGRQLCVSCAENNKVSTDNIETVDKVSDSFREWVKDNNWMCGYEVDDEGNEF